MITIPLKSGLALTCHPIGGQVFTSVDEANNASGEQAIRRTFDACHANTDETGPYNFVIPGGGKPDWNRLHFSDLLQGMIELRIGSFTQPRSELGYINGVTGLLDERPVGQVLEFELSCQATSCGKLFESAVDLREILDTATDWSDEMRLWAARGEELLTKTRGGAVISWRPSTLALNKPMHDAMKRILGPAYGTRACPEGIVDSIVKHVTKVVTPEGKTLGPDVRAIWRWFTRPGNGEDLDLMLRELDERQPTVDNALLLRCIHCGTEQRRALPFGGTFFFPSTSPQLRALRDRLRAAAKEARLRKQEEPPPETSSASSSPA